MFSLFQNSLAFYVYLEIYDFSFATELCLFSHNSLGREKTSPKIKSDILYIFLKCVAYNFFNNFKVTLCKFFTEYMQVC